MSEKHTILITGGASGIGLALAANLLQRGHRVIACGRDDGRLRTAKGRHPGLETIAADVSNAASRSSMLEWLHRDAPELSMLVNNAGIQNYLDLRAADVAVQRVETEISINLNAPILLTMAALPILRKSPNATIVNVTSGLAFCPLAQVPVYCATKAALHSFTLSLRHQLAGVARVVELAPPIVATDLDRDARRPGSGGPPGITPEAFAIEALDRLFAGENEIAVGLAAGLRGRGEALFDDLNRAR
ncbi:MAG TPA: SDR family NAD(P)-dependent oxidoreductase [Polyangiaceae bacterium]|nr:SDR family NAD(P)-dependent oxidoreductase [Polyangiaceae bacterium]